jgi:peptide/nickel transport system permease protein
MPEPVAEPIAPVTDVAASVVAPSVGVVAERPETVEAAPAQKLGVMGWLSIVWVVGVVVVALLAPILPLRDPDRTVSGLARQGPFTAGGILGGDDIGRDMLSRVVFGARWSLLIAVTAVVLGMVVGGLLGLLAGYFRGRVDTVLSPLFNVLLAIPGLVLLLALVAVFAPREGDVSTGRTAIVVIVGIAVLSVPILGRIARASALSWSEREFVRASAVLGARHRRIILREVLPNALPAMASIALLSIGVAIVFEGTLALLGAGLPPNVATWGNIIAVGQANLSRAPHIVVIPSVAIFLTVLSLNYLGDVIRARFDVRESLL